MAWPIGLQALTTSARPGEMTKDNVLLLPGTKLQGKAVETVFAGPS